MTTHLSYNELSLKNIGVRTLTFCDQSIN